VNETRSRRGPLGDRSVVALLEALARATPSDMPVTPRYRQAAPGRDDLRTNFDRLDLDDYVSFGGKS